MSNVETEVKLPVSSLHAIHTRIGELGFVMKTERALEANMLLDTPQSTLRRQGALLRLRQYAGATLLTYKDSGRPGRHKVREEVEVSLDDPETAQILFERLGFQPSFRYEKYRTEYTDGGGVIMIDETPIGNYLELEGDSAWIDRIAAALGFCEQDYITKTYGRLYLEYCEAQGIRPTHMVFQGNT
ncbi:MAG: class IV adenylate cyclase [Acidobacteria bacterium]|nr:class IV adenylate cyclase [Acidobacteriota bacterium]